MIYNKCSDPKCTWKEHQKFDSPTHTSSVGNYYEKEVTSPAIDFCSLLPKNLLKLIACHLLEANDFCTFSRLCKKAHKATEEILSSKYFKKVHEWHLEKQSRHSYEETLEEMKQIKADIIDVLELPVGMRNSFFSKDDTLTIRIEDEEIVIPSLYSYCISEEEPISFETWFLQQTPSLIEKLNKYLGEKEDIKTYCSYANEYKDLYKKYQGWLKLSSAKYHILIKNPERKFEVAMKNYADNLDKHSIETKPHF